jgi:hypothetical protein
MTDLIRNPAAGTLSIWPSYAFFAAQSHFYSALMSQVGVAFAKEQTSEIRKTFRSDQQPFSHWLRRRISVSAACRSCRVVYTVVVWVVGCQSFADQGTACMKRENKIN